VDKRRVSAQWAAAGAGVLLIYPLYLSGILLLDLTLGHREFLSSLFFESKRETVLQMLGDWADSLLVSMLMVIGIEVLVRVLSWRLGRLLLVLGIVGLLAAAFIGPVRACLLLAAVATVAAGRIYLRGRYEI